MRLLRGENTLDSRRALPALCRGRAGGYARSVPGLVDTKAALVTGAGSGIGRACALALAREGARVVVSDVNDAGGEATAREIREADGEAIYVHADVAHESDVQALVGRTLSHFGALDCAVNNAGVTGSAGPLHETSLEDFRRVVDVNLTGVFLCMKHELEAMLPRGGGAIVNVASGSGIIATPGMGAYCSTKHAVLGLTKTAAVENARTDVRVNAVCPGVTDTPLLRENIAGSPQMERLILGSTPSGRMARPEEIAEAVAWLCSDRASFVSGESMLVDGASVAR
jgi:NAD(P)-dependent dehydrogenase (short-subunit alcohol dehydrogenase family)